ncbi:MAG: hypothetical protein LBN92_06705, partial [Treponema sp.]|nr:hypothetical protein [Treponema sp.]
DNQIDFLVNFFQFSVDSLSLDNIKRILALVRYIDWVRFNSETQSPTTKAVVDVVNQARSGGDSLTLSVLNESLDRLGRASGAVMNYLKEAAQYNRESYKNELRDKITGGLSEAGTDLIRKKFPAAMSGKPFYPDLVEELVKEDFGPSGEKLRNDVLKALAIPENKPKTAQKAVSFKEILVEAFPVLGGVSFILADLCGRLDENNLLFNEKKQGFFNRLKDMLDKMFDKKPKPVIYEIEYLDNSRGVTVKEKIDFMAFRADLDKRIRAFASFNSRESQSRFMAMDEKQLCGLLEKAVRETQILHRTLTGLDEFFRAEAPREIRDKVRGIRPELAAMKNAFIKANQKRHEYSARLEEAEQLRKLGVAGP